MWKIFAIITFASQVIRFPAILYILPSADNIKPYVISTSLLLPIYFVSSEVLSFKSNTNKLGGGTISVLALIMAATVIYFIYSFGHNYLVIFFGLALSSILTGISYSKIREKSSPQCLIKCEAIYSAALTGGLIFLCKANDNYNELSNLFSGYTLILSIILFLYSIDFIPVLIDERFSINRLLRRIYKYHTLGRAGSDYTKSTISYTKTRNIAGLLCLLIASQYERSILGLYAPIYLVYISIAGGVLSGFRRIIGNDYIVYEKVLKSNDDDINQLRSDFSNYFFIYLIIAFFSFFSWVILREAEIFSSNSLGKFDALDIKLLLIFLIYCITSPYSIYMHAYFRRGSEVFSLENWFFIIILWLFISFFIVIAVSDFRISPISLIAWSCLFEIILFWHLNKMHGLKIKKIFYFLSCSSIILIVCISSLIIGV
jgi:hypothetical protein